MPACAPSCDGSELRRAFSSTACSPTVAGAQRDTHRVAEPVRRLPATAAPVASFVVTECCETDPTGVATAGWVREWAVCLSGSLQPPPPRLNVNLTG